MKETITQLSYQVLQGHQMYWDLRYGVHFGECDRMEANTIGVMIIIKFAPKWERESI